MTTHLERIRSKLQLKAITLHPRATEATVVAFERRHDIELPAEYRLFITELGNGGPGPPYYDLESLGQTAGDMTPTERDIWSNLPRIREPFPFTRAWTWEADEVSQEGNEEDISRGSFYLGNDGCGMYWHLIVTGPDRGIPWMISGEGIQPVCPKRSFLEWYEDWLDGRDSFYGYSGGS